MVEEHLNAIRSKEEDAKRRIRGTEVEAAAMLEAARKDGERRLEEVRAEASLWARQLLDEAKKRAEGAIKAMRADSEKALAALEDAAAKNEERAIRIMTDSFRDDV